MYHQPGYRKTSNFYEGSDSKSNSSHDSAFRDNVRGGKAANLQEIFLNNCRKNENIVRIETVKGEQRIGKIVGFDSHSVILSSMDTQYLIYKSAITVVIPEQPVQYIFNELHRKSYADVNYINETVDHQPAYEDDYDFDNPYLQVGTEQTGYDS